jgi:UDP-glucuronate 4-epimerase
MRVVVTGACGFIGSHLSEALLAAGHHVVGIDNFNDFYDPARKRDHARQLQQHPRFKLASGDIHDDALWSTVLAAHAPKVDAVVHLAAWAGVRRSLMEPERYHHENVRGTQLVMEAVRQHAPGTPVVFASSSSVYGARAQQQGAFREEDVLAPPSSPYAASKRAAEEWLQDHATTHQQRVVALRYFTVFGPRQRPDMAIARFAHALMHGQALRVFGDGSSARDYTYVGDIVAGTIAAIHHAMTMRLPFRVYNLGNDVVVPLQALLEELQSVMAMPMQLQREPPQPGDVPLTWASIDRARSELGYAPRTSLREGLQQYAQWLRS